MCCKELHFLDLDHWLVLRVQFPLEATLFFADFETDSYQSYTKMPEMLDLCYLGKTRI